MHAIFSVENNECSDGSAQARVIFVKGWLIDIMSSKGETTTINKIFGISFGPAKLKPFDLSDFLSLML